MSDDVDERGPDRGVGTNDPRRTDEGPNRGTAPAAAPPDERMQAGRRESDAGTRWGRYLTIGCGTYLVAVVGSAAILLLFLLFVGFGGGLATPADAASPGAGGGGENGDSGGVARMPGAGAAYLLLVVMYASMFGVAGVLASGLGAAVGYVSDPGESGVLVGAVSNAAGMAAALALPTVLLVLGGVGATSVVVPVLGLAVGAGATGAAGGLVGSFAAGL